MNTEQMVLLLSEGEKLRDTGLEQVAANNTEYFGVFFAEAHQCLKTNGEVTSEAVVERAGMPSGHPSAVGAAMRSFAMENGLVKVGYRKTYRPSRHAAIIAIWKLP